MLKHDRILPLLVITAFAANVGGASRQEAAQVDIERSARELMAETLAEGSAEALAVSVDIAGETLFAHGLGPARRGRAAQANASTAFGAAPMAHTLLVTATLQLQGLGKLNHEDLVNVHISELVAEKCPVRVGDLMAHTSGFPDYRDFASTELLEGAPSFEQLAALVREIPLETRPGECVKDSATDTLLLAALLEEVTGKPVEEVLRSSIFEKLDMNDTGYDLGQQDGQASEAASDKQPTSAAFLPRGLTSTAADLLRFQRGLVDLKLLDSDDLEVMTTPVRLADGSQGNQGLGVIHVLLNETRGLVIGEETPDCGAHVTYYPAFDLTIVVMARGDDLTLDPLARRLARLVIEEPQVGVQDVALTEQDMKAYLGSYQIGCTTLMIRADVGRIVLDELDEQPLVLLNQGDHRFVARDDPDIRLIFEVEGELAHSFVLDKHGMRSTATRFEGDR